MTKRPCEYQRECSILNLPVEELYRSAKIEDCKKYKEFERLIDKWNLNIKQGREWGDGILVLKTFFGHYETEKLMVRGTRAFSGKTKEKFVQDGSFVCEISFDNLSCCYANPLENKYFLSWRELLKIIPV